MMQKHQVRESKKSIQVFYDGVRIKKSLGIELPLRIHYLGCINNMLTCAENLKKWKIPNKSKVSLTRLYHPPIHPFTHPGPYSFAQKGGTVDLLFIFAPILCKLQDRLRPFLTHFYILSSFYQYNIFKLTQNFQLQT